MVMVVSLKKWDKEKSTLHRKEFPGGNWILIGHVTNLKSCKHSRHPSDCYSFDRNSLHSTCC